MGKIHSWFPAWEWPPSKDCKVRPLLIDRHHVLATAKHFAVHGQPEGGTNTAPGNYSERVIRESFLHAVSGGGRGGACGERHGFL